MRNCEYIGNPAMFQSRVSGVSGSLSPETLRALMAGADLGIPGAVACLGPNCQMDGGLSKAQVCHSQSPAGTCMPVDWNPPATTPPAPAKPAASALPLLLGAAYLLLS